MSELTWLQRRCLSGTRLLLALVIVLSMLGIPAESRASNAQAESAAALTVNTAQAYAPDVVLVGVKPGVSIASVMRSPQGSIAPASFAASEPVFRLAQAALTFRPQSAGSNQALSRLARIFKIRLAPGADVAAIIKALSADPNVEFAEPDYLARPAVVPNDSLYGEQWGLTKIGAPAAWDVSTGNSSTIIAIVDSGLDTAHEDFAGQLWSNPNEIPGNGVDDDHNGLVDDVNGWNFVAGNGVLSDDNGHGTQVAGVAGAATNNGKGVAGLCWNCRLMIVKVMQTTGAVNYSDVAAGVAYAAGMGAQVINLSLGGYADSVTLRTVIESAAQTAVVVAGAGNDNKSAPFYPAAYADAIAVASTDQADTKATFSNFGAWVDVAAPGVNIKTTFAGASSYGAENGTSMSAPFVAGLAGLLKSQHPDWPAQLVRAHILNTATSVDGLNPTFAGQLGRGRINAQAALTTGPQPRMSLTAWQLNGQSGAKLTPGQSYQLALTLENTWLPVRNLTGILSTSDPYVSVTDASGAFGDVNTGQSRTNTADTFGVSVSLGVPYNHPIPFTLNLTGSDGYHTSLPVTLMVRSGEEVLGNTIYTADGIWTSDKTYLVQGTVIVYPGVTLTIQPGTVIKGSAGKFIRIDGTLIASGTAASPIVFTAITTTNWSGIKFTDSSVSASFDADGNYVSGSIVRHVDMAGADTAINAGTRSPYIADSIFRQNGTTALQVGSSNNGGSPRIERNMFAGNYTAISLNGGQAVIQQNAFTGSSMATISGSGSPSIISNTFTSNIGMAINMSGASSSAPVIRDNYIVGNGGGIYGTGLQKVEIEHNLIANNGGTGTCPPPCTGGAAVSLDVQSAGASQSSPALVYNPDRDEYLLTWAEGSGMAMDMTLHAQRVLSDGQVIGSVVQVSASTGAMATGVVYNPQQREYLAIWSGYGNVGTQRLAANGALLGNASVVTSTISYGSVRAVHQSVDNTYLVLWQDSSSTPNRLYARRVMSDGTPADVVMPVALEQTANLTLGDAAYDPAKNQTLVVFRSDYWSIRIYGVYLDSSGSAPLPAFVLAEAADGAWLGYPGLAIAPTSGQVFTAWERVHYDGGESHRIYGQAGTTPVTPTVVYSSTSLAYSPRVAYGAGNSQFLTVWYQTNTPSAVQSIYGRRVYTDGLPAGGLVTISTPGTGSRNSPVLAYNSLRNEYLVVWVDARLGSGVLYGQRLGADGQLLDNAWTTADEANPAVNFRLTEARGVRYNTIINNSGGGVQLGGSAAGSVLLAHNNWFGNGTYDVYLTSGAAGTQNFTVTAQNNYWGIPSSQIPSRIYDCTFDANSCNNTSATLGKVAYSPALTAPDQNAPAFVRSATVSPLPLGLQRGAFDVIFSRPMVTTTVPSVSFHDARKGTIATIDAAFVPGSMGQDVMGRMWFGTSNASGVRVFDGTNWFTYTTSSGLGSNGVLSVFGASNGAVWIGHTGSWNGAAASRLQGSTWITYNSQTVINSNDAAAVTAIGEDATGKMWFGVLFGAVSGGAVSFDGTVWRQYTTADGPASNNVRQIVRDGQGHMWFLTGSGGIGTPGGLSVFDGVGWRTYGEADGLPPPMYLGPLFSDSRGRIWVGVYNMVNPATSKIVGMFDGAAWTFYGSAETNGRLVCGVNAFAEDPNGSIWMSSCGNVVVLDGTQWTTKSNLSNVYSPMAFDLRGSLWMGSGGLRVLWGGQDYPVIDNGQWISSTLHRATYDVTPLVPKGNYAVNVEDAVGPDGMDVAPYAGSTFLVDYAGFVSDGTPPTRPVVTAHGDGTLTTLSFNWSSSDAESGIDQYRYAIGTTSGGLDVVDWTYVSKNTTSVTRNGLLLVDGQTYYVTVAARNAQGLWSQNGVSNPVVAGETPQHYIYLPLILRGHQPGNLF